MTGVRAPVDVWVAHPLSDAVRRSIDRLASTDDVVRVAVLPDVHLADQVCVGVAVATRAHLLPAAVGGDIGCGVSALAFDALASVLDEPGVAAAVLAAMASEVPVLCRPVAQALTLPTELDPDALSDPALRRWARREGPLELGTLGRGNHFCELQEGDDGVLWLMVHSGSRGLGPQVRDHHLRSTGRGAALVRLPAGSEAGRAYFADMSWARSFARLSRRHMSETLASVVGALIGATVRWETHIDCDHNHVVEERLSGEPLWVHRKGAISAQEGQPGIIPGSMGTWSFHVEGRGEARSLKSSSHGSGRELARGEARRTITRRDLERQLQGVYYDAARADQLRDEAPSAYKDVAAVMRAQRDLTRIVRRLRPRLVYKG